MSNFLDNFIYPFGKFSLFYVVGVYLELTLEEGFLGLDSEKISIQSYINLVLVPPIKPPGHVMDCGDGHTSILKIRVSGVKSVL